MGFFDKLADKAKEAAENAKKSAGEALENASKVTKEISDKASKEFNEISRKVSEEGRNLYDKASDGFSEFSENVGTSAKELSSWAERMPDKLRKMADDFDAEALWDKLAKTAAKAGQELIVMVLTIYYAIESKIPGLQKPKK